MRIKIHSSRGQVRGRAVTPGAVMTLETVRDVMYCASDGSRRPISINTLYDIERRAMAKVRAHLSGSWPQNN